jgi:protein SCO1/2
MSCTDSSESTNESNEPTYVAFPYIGMHDMGPTDTIYHTVPAFEFMNQDSVLVTNEDVKGKVHVANFFFTSCPAICPAMIAQMQRLQEMTSDIEELVILSHTIDPERDSIPKLVKYIEDREIDTKNWHFLRGERQYTHDLGKDGYMVNAMVDEEAEGGFLHSEHFVLIDREGHIRGLYIGTETDQVDQLAEDIKILIENEY